MNALSPSDRTCYRYDFPTPANQAFYQEGTPQRPIVYWLDVQAQPGGGLAPHKFGWKTSTNHWHDDACWVFGTELYSGRWNELHNPPNHPDAGKSIDLAVRLTTKEVPIPTEDSGDAPPIRPPQAVIRPCWSMTGRGTRLCLVCSWAE